MKKKPEFWEGCELVCKKHYKTANKRLYVNYRYILKSIGAKFLIVTELVEQNDIILDLDKLAHFKLSYANTCDSVQGLTMDKSFTIFDANTPM
jgi:hypothetical protein